MLLSNATTRCLQHLVLLWIVVAEQAFAQYHVGIGKADITGPVADVNLMGYAMPLQIARGIHTRLFARAYIFADANDHRLVYVVSDACMSSQLVTMRILQRLKDSYGELYSADNVMLSGTHTHASPAGFLQYVLYTVTSLGFVEQSFDAMVDGIMEAIDAAHADVSPAAVWWSSGELLGANINRSPTAYLNNPQTELDVYQHDVDKQMEVIKITRAHTDATGQSGGLAAGEPGGDVRYDYAGGGGCTTMYDCGRGVISWFPVHCTSMNNTNPFVSGDNKGAAAQLLERAAKKKRQVKSTQQEDNRRKTRQAAPSWAQWLWHEVLQVLLYWPANWHLLDMMQQTRHQLFRSATVSSKQTTDFVAAFAQSSVGDTSPNVQGAYCLDTGEPCEMSSSTCGGRNELCVGRGPAWPDDMASTAVIAQLQADKVVELWRQQGVKVTGPIDYRHVYINMSDTQVSASRWTRAGHTCPPAMGFSFAAGTTDGPGAFDFIQGDTTGTAFWRLVRNLLSSPSAEQSACHAPKPILLNTGYMNTPYPWQPHITELSVFRLGNIVLLGVPGEFSTMAGRRIKAAVLETIGGAWGDDVKVILSGLSGTYSSYITTWEEYQVQRYEGASTAYGPHTLGAYIQTAVQLVKAMLSGDPVTSSVSPPDLHSSQLSFLGPVVVDAVPAGAEFGDVVVQPMMTYTPGQTVEAVFRSGCPRNKLRRGGTFLSVQQLDPLDTGSWLDVASDDDWETHFYWERHWKLSTQSFATIRWSIPPDTPPGTYRLVHHGDWKPLFGSPRSFSGISRVFLVLSDSDSNNLQQAGASRVSAAQSEPHTAFSAYKDWLQTASQLHVEGAGTHFEMLNTLGSTESCWAVHKAPQQDFLLGVHNSTAATPESRWSALSALYESATQYRSRFGCSQHYVAWWRGEGGCRGAPDNSRLMRTVCTYGLVEPLSG